MDDYERVLMVKQEVFVYRIPPLASARGHKAADWKLDSPDYVCRLRVVARGEKLELKLEEKASGELFAKCPVDKYPGSAVEPVLDSSRYFVMRLQDDNGRSALIGVGFADRGDSFDLNVALQDHFRYIGKAAKLQQDEETQAASNQPKLDLGFKAGQTITLNIGKKDTAGGSSSGNATSRPRSAGTGNVGGPVPLLPPPPSSGSSVAKGRASPSSATLQQQQQQRAAPAVSSSASPSLNPFLSYGGSTTTGTNVSKPSNALLDFDAFTSSLPPAAAAPSKAPANPFAATAWGSAEETTRELRQPTTPASSTAVGNLLDL